MKKLKFASGVGKLQRDLKFTVVQNAFSRYALIYSVCSGRKIWMTWIGLRHVLMTTQIAATLKSLAEKMVMTALARDYSTVLVISFIDFSGAYNRSDDLSRESEPVSQRRNPGYTNAV